MEGIKINRVREAILDFIDLVEDPVEYIALVGFNDDVKEVIELDSVGSTEGRWCNASGRIAAEGGTSLYDAVAYALDMLEGIGNPERSNIIIALTDGEDTDSRYSLEQVTRRIEEASVEITFIGLAYREGQGGDYNLGVLEQLAAAGNAEEWALEATPTNVRETFRFLTKWFQDDDPTAGAGLAYSRCVSEGGGTMYWTDSDADRIQRANLNGSGVEDLVTSGLDGPHGIALVIKSK